MGEPHFRVTISIDGPKEINDVLRVDQNGEGTYERIKQGISVLLEAGCMLQAFEATYTSLHKKRGYTIAGISAFLKSTFIDIPVIVEECSVINVRNNDEIIGEIESSPINTGVSDSAGYIKLDIYKKLQADKFCDIGCYAGLRSLALMPDGSLYPCHFFVSDNKYPLGTVVDFPESDALEETTTIMHNTRRTNREQCAGCWATELCSMCPAHLLLFGDGDQYAQCVKMREKLSSILLSIAQMSIDKTLSVHTASLISHTGLVSAN